MLLSDYYSHSSSSVQFTREQGSGFAKTVADDFNPLHDIEARRFVVPGDLLFAVMLQQYGLSQSMHFSFTAMVPADLELLTPASNADEFELLDANDKQYLKLQRSGAMSANTELIQHFTHAYVSFSGHAFPHILVPLMKRANIMINPSRPMVMYESMHIELEHMDIVAPELVLDEDLTTIEVNGKRGVVALAFKLLENNTLVGRGQKHMLLSGLREFDQQAMDTVVADYAQRKLTALS